MAERKPWERGGGERAIGAADFAPSPYGGIPRRKRARKEIASPAEPRQPILAGESRRLTDAERRALRQRRRAKIEAAKPPPPPKPEPPVVAVEAVEDAPRGAEHRNGSRGMVALGALLICGLTLLGFGGGRLFGQFGGDDPDRERTVADGGGPTVGSGEASDPSRASPLGTPDLGFAPDPATPPPVAAQPPPGQAPVVCIDPGHGGPLDRGRSPLEASSLAWLDEASVVLQHAWDLEARLKLQGYTVVLTRHTDTAVNPSGADVNGDGKTLRHGKQAGDLDELQARINLCNQAGADLLVSMHVNGFDRAEARGYETFFTKERPFGDQSHRFATLVYRNLKDQLAAIGYVLPEAEERGVRADTEVDRQTEHAQFEHFVLTGPAVEGKVDPSRMPGALVETLFITNEVDAAILASPEGRYAIANAYELAVVRYFQEFPVS